MMIIIMMVISFISIEFAADDDEDDDVGVEINLYGIRRSSLYVRHSGGSSIERSAAIINTGQPTYILSAPQSP